MSVYEYNRTHKTKHSAKHFQEIDGNVIPRSIHQPWTGRGNNDVHSESVYEPFMGIATVEPTWNKGWNKGWSHSMSNRSLQMPEDNRIVATTIKHATTDTFFVRRLDRRTTTERIIQQNNYIVERV